ncbi:MAG: hypothetical protein ACE5KS_02595 [Woeseiaceae bacterium]
MIEHDLQTMANIAELLGGVSIVAALTFGVFQIREFKKRRRDAVAAGLMQSFYSADLAHAVSLLRLLPDGISAEQLREQGLQYEESAILVTTTFETMGILVHRGIAPFSLVEELAGGIAVVMWRKISAWLETVREEQNQPSWAEWYQWLVDQFAAVEGCKQPAHLRLKDRQRYHCADVV